MLKQGNKKIIVNFFLSVSESLSAHAEEKQREINNETLVLDTSASGQMMANPKPIVEISNYGIYDKWDAESKQLPKIKKFTTTVEAIIDIEFGLVVNIKKAKGQKIRFCIYHPNLKDKNGRVMAPFDGEEYIKSNNWDFYLGDTIWAPQIDKVGEWRMVIELRGQVVAEKTFNVIEESKIKGRFANML